MPVIHAGWYHASRSQYCIGMEHQDRQYIERGDRYLRVYGYAHEGEEPSAVCLCEKCGERWLDSVPAAAIEITGALERGGFAMLPRALLERAMDSLERQAEARTKRALRQTLGEV